MSTIGSRDAALNNLTSQRMLHSGYLFVEERYMLFCSIGATLCYTNL
ncbi:hypothetical protein [Mucilaginibacter flavus]|nr:hypothetical protein [Mucilaginibacter flavus]